MTSNNSLHIQDLKTGELKGRISLGGKVPPTAADRALAIKEFKDMTVDVDARADAYYAKAKEVFQTAVDKAAKDVKDAGLKVSNSEGLAFEAIEENLKTYIQARAVEQGLVEVANKELAEIAVKVEGLKSLPRQAIRLIEEQALEEGDPGYSREPENTPQLNEIASE